MCREAVRKKLPSFPHPILCHLSLRDPSLHALASEQSRAKPRPTASDQRRGHFVRRFLQLRDEEAILVTKDTMSRVVCTTRRKKQHQDLLAAATEGDEETDCLLLCSGCSHVVHMGIISAC